MCSARTETCFVTYSDLSLATTDLEGNQIGFAIGVGPGVTKAARTTAAAATGTRAATTAFGRSVQSLRDALSSGGGPWTQVSAHAERATARAYRGGTSIEQIFVNRETGQRIVRHTIVRGDDVLHETFRPYAKFGMD